MPSRTAGLTLALALPLFACGPGDDAAVRSAASPAGGDSAAASSGASAAAALANGDFESGQLEPWSTLVHADPESLKVEFDAGQARTGSSSIRLAATGTEPWGGISQTLPAQPLHGRRMRLSAWVKGEQLTGSPSLLAIFEGGPWTDPVDLDFEGLGPQFDWQQIDTSFEVPASAQQFQVGVLIKGGGILWIDDVALEPVP